MKGVGVTGGISVQEPKTRGVELGLWMGRETELR